MEQRKEAIICLEGLGKQFQTTNGTVTALDDINLEILQGEIFGIIGLSGAGKSTLVRCINYLETPTAGRVIFEGQNLSMMKESEIRKARQSMGMIFQQFKELLAKEGVKEIEAEGKEFDPELMDAVMHIEDESLGENVVAQVFQAGFELNGKVLRHAIVQVAN